MQIQITYTYISEESDSTIATCDDPSKFWDNAECIREPFAAQPSDRIADLESKSQEETGLDLVRGSQFIYPPSQYNGFVPPLPISKERNIIAAFMQNAGRDPKAGQGRATNASFDGQAFTEFDLSNFSIYLPGSVAHHSWELQGLQNLSTKTGNSSYLFDGILSDGSEKYYLQAVPFKFCSIGNYGADTACVDGNIWIQSDFNKGTEVYYRLKDPASQYTRYHSGFMWLADLAKHFVDYAQSHLDKGHLVSIYDFRYDFFSWLDNTYGDSPGYQSWFKSYDHCDFRRAVAANVGFLFKESVGVNDDLHDLPIWKEVMTVDHIPTQKQVQEATVVTPYVYDCFRHLKFGTKLKEFDPAGTTQERRMSLGKILHLSIDRPHRKSGKLNNVLTLEASEKAAAAARKASITDILGRRFDPKTISIGDVLGVPKDDQQMSKWKDEVSNWKAADDCWYVYVQGIHFDKKGQRRFNVIWLYRPSDTTCAKMRYSYANELFFSTNCSCNSALITEDEVMYKVSVDWYGSPEKSKADFFIRQTYLENNSFVTLKNEHKHCVHPQSRDESKIHLNKLTKSYKVGDTVLARPPVYLKSPHGLEPCEIDEFIQDGSKGMVVLRRLLRRAEFDGKGSKARPNELIYSDDLFTISATNVERKCYIRFYTADQVERLQVPAPYNRDGTGDAYYISTRVVGTDRARELRQLTPDTYPESLLQGFNPDVPPPREPLRGMDLYCGGGNLGRGLEEGGAVKNKFAVDLNANALHTYYANLEHSSDTELYLGSVDDLLEEALAGNPSGSKLIPLPGDVDFISAGSPCQGFSLMNSKRHNEKGLKNQSLVASVASYVDFYRPKYALLENVVSMAQKGRGRDEDVLSQLICCLVGMGYQVQVFTLDAWSFGSPQSRSRLFVSIAAPGLKLPRHPGLSHSHPAGTSDRGLGKMANGHAFGERRFQPTPFEFVTVGEADGDLPDIGDGRTGMCIAFPDHRMPRGISKKLQAQMEVIPLAPYGMNFIKTYTRGLMTETERALFPFYTKSGKVRHSVKATSRAWERLNPLKLFPTIATGISPEDFINGRALHWNQQRMITVMEVRRAQGYPDHEVLTGSPPEQWKIIGNSVSRTVALALGLSLREAWLENPPSRPILPYPPIRFRPRIVATDDDPKIVWNSIMATSRYSPKISQTENKANEGQVAGKKPLSTISIDSISSSSENEEARSMHSAQMTGIAPQIARKRMHNLPFMAEESQLKKRKTLPEFKSVASKVPKVDTGASRVPTRNFDILISPKDMTPSKEVVDLVSDSSTDDVIFVSSNTTSKSEKTIYVPADDSIFNAYACTHTKMVKKNGKLGAQLLDYLE